ncbi:MAG: hypothetical protein OXC68_10925 [Aestuariivita sp.]|nr:hypothetical protein [Aestuariivita sp.]
MAAKAERGGKSVDWQFTTEKSRSKLNHFTQQFNNGETLVQQVLYEIDYCGSESGSIGYFRDPPTDSDPSDLFVRGTSVTQSARYVGISRSTAYRGL